MAALNDPSRARISDPRRGNYHVSIATADVHEATELAEGLDLLDVVFQANYPRDRDGRPRGVFLAVYEHDSQKRLLEAIRNELTESRRSALETLVLARGPIPTDILERIWRAFNLNGWEAEAIAVKMNELGIVAGMGGIGWTVRKVRAAIEQYEPPIAEQEAA